MSDPADPASCPRRILLCVVGLTPQVVTETLWALAVQADPPFVPNELVIVTTSQGAERIELMLTDGRRILDQLARDWPGRGLEGLAGRTRLVQVQAEDGSPLADIASREANTALADLLVETVRELTADPASALHLSIAGGRKTMGFLAGYALSLLGRPQDRLSHVLVDPAFEQHQEFYYPPPKPTVLLSQSKDQKPIRTDRSGLVLAEIPFVRMRAGLPEDLLAGRTSFAHAVQGLQERFRPVELVVDLAGRSAVAHGRQLRLAPVQLAFLAVLAEHRARFGEADPGLVAGAPLPQALLDAYGRLAGPEAAAGLARKLGDVLEPAWLTERASRHNKIVTACLPGDSSPYRIVRDGRKPRTTYRLAVPPEAIRLVGGDAGADRARNEW